MAENLYCKSCKKLMAELRDASVRRDLVCLCNDCWSKLDRLAAAAFSKKTNVTDLFGGLFK